MIIPTLFGFPAWRGRIKPRVAKKYLNSWSIGWFLKRQNHERFANIKIGDLVNDCSGFNGEVLEITPLYTGEVLSRRTERWNRIANGVSLLYDIDLRTSNTCCSLISCGVELELSRESIEARHLSFIENWVLGEDGKRWYGDNTEEIERAKIKLELLRSGGHVADERGRLLRC